MNSYWDNVECYIHELRKEGYEVSFAYDVFKDQLFIRVKKGNQRFCEIVEIVYGYSPFIIKMVIRDLVNRIENSVGFVCPE